MMNNRCEEIGECINMFKETPVDIIDLDSIVKASKILATEFDIHKTIDRFMNIILEYEEATKVVFLMDEENSLKIISSWDVTDNVIRVFDVHKGEDLKEKEISLPMKIVNFVRNTQKKVLYQTNEENSELDDYKYFETEKPKSILCIPIILRNTLQGIIYLENNMIYKAFNNEDIQILNVLLIELIISIENVKLCTGFEEKVKERTMELIKITEKYKKLSITDQLTGLLNRRELDNRLYQEFYKVRKSGEFLSVIILDVDHFKVINDKFGHHVGDIVLINLADLLKDNARRQDFVGRWGGEEFMIICPETDSKQVYDVCEKMRKVIEELQIPEIGGITASFGASTYKENDSIETFIKRADEGLYKAKNSGRNKCVFN